MLRSRLLGFRIGVLSGLRMKRFEKEVICCSCSLVDSVRFKRIAKGRQSVYYYDISRFTIMRVLIDYDAPGFVVYNAGIFM